MKKLLAMAVVILMSSSCVKNVKGSLDVQQTLTLKAKRGKVTMNSGSYDAEIKIKRRNKIDLETRVNGKKQKIRFSLPSGTSLSADGGSLRLRADEINQPVDISAEVRKETVNVGEIEKYPNQGCEGIVRERQCRNTPSGQECVVKKVMIYGEREIWWQKVEDFTDVELTMISPDSQETLAVFKGRKSEGKRSVLVKRTLCQRVR